MTIEAFPIATVSAASFLTDAATARDAAEAAALDAFTTGANKSGFGRHARNTLDTLSMWSEDYLSADGAGGTIYLPRAITASQTAATVTASSALFEKLYVGARIVWDSGEEAVITAVDNSGAGWANIATCTVDRSQTVASGPATLRAKHLLGVTYGDSVGNRISPVLQKLMYRALGFGGYIINANNLEQTFGSQIAEASFAGGAADATDDGGLPDYPWGQYWTVPSAGSITFGLLNQFAVGAARKLRHGLEPDERKHDTAVLVWRRGAGAFTVERKRFWDAAWSAVATVADASTGSTNYNHLTWKHALGSEWQYRITSTSGTINVLSFTFRNDTKPGYIHWPLSRGGRDISQFDELSSAELAELCLIHGQPDFRCVFAYDTIPGTTTVATYRATLDLDRALWQAAAPRTDHVWFENWEGSANQAEQVAWNTAIKQIALESDDTLVPLYELFGDFATAGSLRGWIEDGVHPTIRGEVIIGHMFLRALGVADHPTIKEGRDVDARRGDFASLFVLGDNLVSRVENLEAPLEKERRGAKWINAFFLNKTALDAALGTGDFTIHIHMDVNTLTNDQNIAIISENANTASTAGQLTVFRNNAGQLRIFLRSAAGNEYEYRYAQAFVPIAGTSGVLTIRSDVANTRFDLFWNGRPMYWVVGSIVAGTGLALGTWIGTGQEFGISQGTVAGREGDIFSAMVWLDRLTDAQIRAAALADGPAGTSPEFYWRFNEGAGRVVRDFSGNNRNGVLLLGNPNQYNLSNQLVWKYPSGSGFVPAWEANLNATTTLVPNDDVIARYTGTRDMLLPATPRVGDRIRVTKATSNTVRITQPALHQIRTGVGTTVGTNATTIGTGGRIQFGGSYDSVSLVCVRAETAVAYEWVVDVLAGAALTWT